ncbi:MAG: asparagine synthase (glutamine-hydrolyzing), partial [Bacteroidota bacterium]
MCGITGIYAFNELGRFHSIKLSQATESLGKRGPDFQNMSLHHAVNLGHTRLSIIDVSHEANQPFKDDSGRYTIVFNGEIYNYQEIRKYLEGKGRSFRSQSDTEVLLQGFMQEGEQILHHLQGFFAFAIYDEQEEVLFLARDRMGIKPLLIYQDEDKLIFASEMKALLRFGISKELDYTSLFQYLQFNYLPGPISILKNVRKLPPGHFLRLHKREIEEKAYYTLDQPQITKVNEPSSYETQKEKVITLLDRSVQQRLIADVPLGAFLSGGIDSSVITALASRHTEQLRTFSIGYQEEKFFDETAYARLVAKKFNTQHTVFSLRNQDLYDHLFEVLDYLDEPFADSSALAVYILSKKTRSKVKVALSGDGADELFSGYNKHQAEFRARKGGILGQMIHGLGPLWKKLPQSRNGLLSNKFRQFHRFSEGLDLGNQERYWRWAAISPASEVEALLTEQAKSRIDFERYQSGKSRLLAGIHEIASPGAANVAAFNDVLYTDMRMVLEGDMLRKVDLMSMANSLEVRVPFLDHQLVEYVMRLPVPSKINHTMRKRILQDAFRDILPKELYRRPKKGFEVPLLKWFRTELRSMIEEDLLAENFVKEQGIFDPKQVLRLRKQLFSSNPGDVHARIWALLVFQYWWKKYQQGPNAGVDISGVRRKELLSQPQ